MVPPTASLFEAIEKMQKSHIGSVVVAFSDEPVGIFTERDLLMKVGVNEVNLKESMVKDYMTQNPVSVKESERIGATLLKMRMGRFRHVVIVNDDNHATHMISIKDVMDYLVDVLSETTNLDVA